MDNFYKIVSSIGILFLCSCSVPAFLFKEQRIRYVLTEKNGIIYSTMGADEIFPEPVKTSEGLKIRWGVMIQNNSESPIEIKPQLSRVKILKRYTSPICESNPTEFNEVLKVQPAMRSKVICTLAINSHQFPELLTSDQWIEFSIPYTRKTDEEKIVFSYKINVEDFQ